MSRARARGRHLDTRQVLDFLEDRLDSVQRREVETHLGTPCAECRERLRALGGLIETMRADRTPEVPASLRVRALALFAPAPARASVGRRIESLARLVFDSWAAPLPATARRAVGEVRRLRFAVGKDVLDLECEAEGRGTVSLRGSLRVAEPAEWTIRLAVGAERFTAHLDARGAFALDHVPTGRARVTVYGPGLRFRLEAFDV